MNTPRLEWKVGLFVLIALFFVAGMILRFSKGTPFFVQTYSLYLQTPDVGGIRPGAKVLMGGVPIGDVQTMVLEHGGKTVTIHVRILDRYTIYGDARFTVQQVGFLGDQLIAVLPGPNEVPPLEDGDVVECEPPFNIGDAVRFTTGLLERADETAGRLNTIVARIDETLLTEETLLQLSDTVGNFKLLSDRALTTLAGIDLLVQTNAHPLSLSVSNLVLFSDQLNYLATQLQETVETNRTEISAAIKNVESATLQIDRIMTGLADGDGLMGSLLNSSQLQFDFHETLVNLKILSSNLTQHGILWRPNRPRVTQSPLYPGRHPFD